MRMYKKHIYIIAPISVVTFALAVLLHYLKPCSESDFWINVCLGIFSGAILTLITSIISYNHEKRRTLESFIYHTRYILSYLNKYQQSMSIEQKINFYLNYIELDKSGWDMEFGNMDFFFERLTESRKYIYEKIYKPIIDFNNAVSNHEWHFRWYLDGSGKNDFVIEGFLSELQDYLLINNKSNFPAEYDDDGNVIRYCQCLTTISKLVDSIRRELGGRYYEIMYGKKVAKKQKNTED